MFYEPFYAYEEVLATFGDKPLQTNSLLASAERLASYLTDGAVIHLEPPTEVDRQRILSLYARQKPVAEPVTVPTSANEPPTSRKSWGTNEKLFSATQGAAGGQSALLNIPDRNPFFTGREQVLAELQEALAERGRATLSGLGGVGKTQTALEYAHRNFDNYLYTFWTSAQSQESLVSGYVTIAGLLKLPEAKDKDQTLAVEAVRRWFTSNDGWLLILDNADDLGMARAFIPPGRKAM